MRDPINSTLAIRSLSDGQPLVGLAAALILPILPSQHSSVVDMNIRVEKSTSPPVELDVSIEGSSPKRFLFGQLPYDIRVPVYNLLLTRNYTLEISMSSPETSSILPEVLLDQSHLEPVVLRLNKAINSEAIPCLYAQNTFYFANLQDCRAFTDPAIAERALTTRISLPRMAMSRPISRWKVLHHYLPSELQELSVEIDTYHITLLEICERLRRGLRIFLGNIRDEKIRLQFFKDKIKIRIRSLKHLKAKVLAARNEDCENSEHKAGWDRVVASLEDTHAAVERSFKDLIGAALVSREE